jgi:hypothetical protein
MPSNERKLELEQQLRSSPYPPRAKAQFTAANDHNPLILQDCPECRGSGKRDLRSEDASGARTWTLGSCSACGGTGISGQIEHYFLADAPEATAIPDADGWLRCPGCRIVFTTRDPDRWTGYRHLRCGQRIRTSTDDA